MRACAYIVIRMIDARCVITPLVVCFRMPPPGPVLRAIFGSAEAFIIANYEIRTLLCLGAVWRKRPPTKKAEKGGWVVYRELWLILLALKPFTRRKSPGRTSRCCSSCRLSCFSRIRCKPYRFCTVSWWWQRLRSSFYLKLERQSENPLKAWQHFSERVAFPFWLPSASHSSGSIEASPMMLQPHYEIPREAFSFAKQSIYRLDMKESV